MQNENDQGADPDGGAVSVFRGRVEELERERVFDGFVSLDRVRHRFERFDGSMSQPLERLVLERGDAVGVLLLNRCDRTVVLIQQFRYAAYERGGPGWLVEIPAGRVEEGDSAEATARREVLEETGYQIDDLEHVMTIYPSPGASSERIHLYVAQIRPEQRLALGGGIDVGEEILVQEIPVNQALAVVAEGCIQDAKTILMLQYLALHPELL